MRHPILSVCVGLALVVAVAAPAEAQRSPDTATLDRGDGIPRFGIDFGLSFLDAPPYDAALRIEPYAQYVWRSGLGLYGTVPFARSFGGREGEPPPEAENATAIGNLELGGLYVVNSSPRTSWVLRFGLALPTASDGRPGALTNALGTYPRLTDLALAVPDAYYLRIALSPLIFGDRLFFRADLGFDLGLGSNDASDPDDLVRFNVGGGIDVGAVALGLELVNLFDLDADEELLHSLAFTLRFMGESLQPVIAIGTPLDDSQRSQVDLFVSAGIQILLR